MTIDEASAAGAADCRDSTPFARWPKAERRRGPIYEAYRRGWYRHANEPVHRRGRKRA